MTEISRGATRPTDRDGLADRCRLGGLLPLRKLRPPLGQITDYAADRLAGHVAKRHKRPRAYGWSVLAFNRQTGSD